MRLVAAFIGCALGIPCGALGSQTPLRIGLVQQPNSLDPLHAVQFYENYIAEATFSALTVIDDHGNVAADLAQRVPTRANGDISADGKTITYHLRHGVRWQDGVPLTSHDVAFTLRKMRDPRTNFPEASVYTAIDRLDTPNDDTVVVHLHAAWADATSQLFIGGQDGSIVPEHVLRDVADLTTAAFESAPIGSGPYRVERWDRGTDIVLAANPTYFRGPPHIAHIRIEFVPDANTLPIRIRTGELDFSPQLPTGAMTQLTSMPGIRHTQAATYNDVQLGFNTKVAPFDDARVRRALVLALDRSRIASAVFHGYAVPATDLVPPQANAFVRDARRKPNGDIRSAAALLDAAGWRIGPSGLRAKNGVPLAFAITLPAGYVGVIGTGLQVQSTWHALGADVTMKTVPSNVMLAPATGLLPSGKFAVELVTNGYATSPDRSDTLTTSGLPPNGRNYFRYTDHDVDQWTEAARTTFDERARNALYAKVSARVTRDAPMAPLIWQVQVYAYASRLSGLRPEPVNSDLWNVYDWRIGKSASLP